MKLETLVGAGIILFLVVTITMSVRFSMWEAQHCKVTDVRQEMREDEDDLFGDDDLWEVTTLTCDNGKQRYREVEID